MNFLKKIQEQSEETKKIILWSIVAVMAVTFSVWRIGIFHARIVETREEFAAVVHQENMGSIREGFSDIKEIINEARETTSLVKTSGTEMIEDILLIQEYIEKNSSDPQSDLKRLEEDEEFWKLILQEAKLKQEEE